MCANCESDIYSLCKVCFTNSSKCKKCNNYVVNDYMNKCTNCSTLIHNQCEYMMHFTKYENNTNDQIIFDGVSDNDGSDYKNDKKRKSHSDFEDSSENEKRVLIKNDSDEQSDTSVKTQNISFCMNCVRNIIQNSIK